MSEHPKQNSSDANNVSDVSDASNGNKVSGANNASDPNVIANRQKSCSS